MDNSSKHVVVGVTGSIAAIKTPEMVRMLLDRGYKVSCVLTEEAKHFVSTLALSTFIGEPVVSDMFGVDAHKIHHIRLTNAADLYLVAPVTATVLARCAYGLCEDMVSLMYISTTTPVLMAPAMHNTMWEHAATQASVKILKERGVKFVGPYQGPLADHTHAEGRMADPEEIVRVADEILQIQKS